MKPTTILNQTLASTHLDAHQEKNSREFLENIAQKYKGKRMPLHQQHDMSRETIGYAENLRVVQDENSEEYLLKADVHFTCDTLEEALGGFSYSYVEPITPNYNTAAYRICLPFPLYNDKIYIKYLAESDPDLAVGAWHKKQLAPDTIGLLFSGLCFIFGPMWNNTYNEHIAPNIKKLIGHLSQMKDKGLSADLVQMVVGAKGEEVGVHFIPDRGHETESFDPKRIEQGLVEVEKFISTDEKSKRIGLYRAKVYFDRGVGKYKLFHAEYLDGTDVNIV